MATLTDLLSSTRTSLDAGDDAAALTSLLAAWKDVRHPRLADAIDRVSERLTPKQPAVAGKTVKDRTFMLLERAKKASPAELGLLLAVPWPGTWQPALPVMNAFRAFEDPRVAMAFCKLVEATPYDTYTSHRFYGPLLAHVAKLRDPRVIPILKADQLRVKSTYWRQGTRVSIEQTLEALKKYPPPPFTPAEEEALQSVESVFAAKVSAAKTEQKTEAQYLAEIYAAPDDDGPRAVFADWLTEKGDPRGEFIALQLARAQAPASEAALKRERTLLNKHEKKWLGERDRVLEKDGREWRRGFLSRGVIEVEYGTREPGAELLDAAWNALETLGLSWRAARSIGEHLMRVGWFSHVRATRGVPEELIHVLARQPPNERLRELDFQLDATLTHEARAAVYSGKPFPAVRRLTMEGELDLAAAFLTSPLGKQLTHVTHVVHSSHLTNWRAVAAKAGLPKLEALSVASPYRGRRGNHWKLTFTRDDSGRFTKLSGDADLDAKRLPEPDGLIDALAHLADDSLTEIRISRALPCEYGQAELTKVKAALERFPSAKVDVPWQQLAVVETPANAVPARLVFLGAPTEAGAKVAPFLDAATKLGVSFDGYEVDGGKLLALDEPIADVVAGVFKKKRTREVTFLRKGQTWTALEFERGGVELAWPFVPGRESPLKWVAELIDDLGAESARAMFRTVKDGVWVFRHDTPSLRPVRAPAQWLVTLPASLDARLPFDGLQQRFGQRPLDWVQARRLKNGNLLLQLGPSPAELPTKEQFDALFELFAESVWQQWTKELGFSPTDWLTRDAAKVFAAHGFTPIEPNLVERQRGELRFHASPPTGTRAVVVRLDDLVAQRIAVQLTALHTPGRLDVDLTSPSHEANAAAQRTWVQLKTGLVKAALSLDELEQALSGELKQFFEPPPARRTRTSR